MATEVLNLDEDSPDGEGQDKDYFTLDGRRWHWRSIDEVRPGALNLAFNSDASSVAQAVAQVGPFFRAMIIDEEWPDFEAMMNAEDSALDNRKAKLLSSLLVEKVLGIPTMPPEPSTAGRRTTGSKSRAVSSSRATRRKAS